MGTVVLYGPYVFYYTFGLWFAPRYHWGQAHALPLAARIPLTLVAAAYAPVFVFARLVDWGKSYSPPAHSAGCPDTYTVDVDRAQRAKRIQARISGELPIVPVRDPFEPPEHAGALAARYMRSSTKAQEANLLERAWSGNGQLKDQLRVHELKRGSRRWLPQRSSRTSGPTSEGEGIM